MDVYGSGISGCSASSVGSLKVRVCEAAAGLGQCFSALMVLIVLKSTDGSMLGIGGLHDQCVLYKVMLKVYMTTIRCIWVHMGV